MNNHLVGLGNKHAKINVYIANIPPLKQYQQQNSVRAIQAGEIATIAQQTGNHWRKVFNVFAKFIFELESPQGISRWQDFREQGLLQSSSDQCLWFSSPPPKLNEQAIHIIMGKIYAQSLGWTEKCTWLSPSFAINEQHKVIICPYFDYRQLSNIKIAQLCRLVQQLKS